MFNFDFKNTAINDSLRWSRQPVFAFANLFKKIFLGLSFISFLLFSYGFLSENFTLILNRTLFGAFLVFFSSYLSFWLIDVFFSMRLAKPKLTIEISQAALRPENFNIAEFFSIEVAKAVGKTIKFCEVKGVEANSTALFYFLLKDNPKFNFIFSRLLLDISDIKKNLEERIKSFEEKTPVKLYASNFENTVLESLWIAQGKGHQRIEKGDLLVALAKCDSFFREILISVRLKVTDIESLVRWLEYLEKTIEEQKKFWEWKNLKMMGSLAKEWTAGYTLTLDRFSVDLTEIVKNQGYPETIGHQKAIAEMERILARRQGNAVLIVGEPGSGRKSMVWALARKSSLGESLSGVNYKRVVQLDLAALLSQAGGPEEAAPLLDTVLKEVIAAGNIILVIDEFYNFVGENAKLGMFDISGIISPYLTASQIQLVAITSYGGLHKNIEQNSALLTLLEKIEVSEISERETLILLENLSLVLEKKYKKFVSFPALRDIIFYCAKYLSAIPFPEKAMELLEELMVYISQTKEPMLLPKHVAKIISEKTKIPVGDIEAKEREVLLHLEELIHERIINQEEAVEEISGALRRARAEVVARKGPMGTFLFLGPTGVGKTETSKALAEIYFGSEERMIRLDMSEFQTIPDVSRLIGSAGQEGLLTTKVREHAFSLVLLDEIEKAHTNVLNLFLQVLDEGQLTDGLGRKVDFSNTIIIATSNAGYQIILDALKKEGGWLDIKERLLDYLFTNAIFRPEFINRFDAVVVFKPLSRENLLAIAGLLLNKIKKNLSLKDIEFVISEPLKKEIVELSYNPIFGAREMKRVIQDKVENVLASAILSGKIKRGNRVEVTPVNFELKIG